VVEVDVEVGGGVVTVDVSREEVDGLELEVVAGLGRDGVEVVWWKDLLVIVVLEKVKEMVEIW